MEISKLKQNSKEIRKLILKQVYSAQSGHPGGALSCADILCVLFLDQMRFDLEYENRDRFVLSKGHASAALYATLAIKGDIPKEDLDSFRNINSYLQGHPDMNKIKGVDMTTGSLGQGLSSSIGMALCSKMDNKNFRVYCLLGDGEIEEGQIWEATMCASHYKLDNLCVIIDNNNLQIDGPIDKIMNSYPIDEKFKSFGFETIIIDGNDIEDIVKALEFAKTIKGKPTAIIAKTVKGKGVSYMEDNVEWHGKAPNKKEYEQAIEELS